MFLKNLVLFVFLVISALVVVPLGLVWLADGLLTFSVGDFRFLGLVSIGVGAIFMLNMFVYFALAGRGTPAPFDLPKRLVTHGFFRYVRNSGYIGGVLIIARALKASFSPKHPTIRNFFNLGKCTLYVSKHTQLTQTTATISIE